MHCQNIIFIDDAIHDGGHNKGGDHIEYGMLFDKHSGQYDGNTKQERKNPYRPFSGKLIVFIMAKCAPRELYTCMLGHRLVGVSALYRWDTIIVKILSLGNTAGLR